MVISFLGIHEGLFSTKTAEKAKGRDFQGINIFQNMVIGTNGGVQESFRSSHKTKMRGPKMADGVWKGVYP